MKDLILLVEDNAADAELTRRAFIRNQIVHRIIHLEDGQEALDYLYETTNEIPRLILLDLKMPRVNGIEVLRKIKADPEKRTIPVVMLTSSREERDIIESYQLGVNAYIVKPLDFTMFTNAIVQIGSFWMLMNEVPR